MLNCCCWVCVSLHSIIINRQNQCNWLQKKYLLNFGASRIIILAFFLTNFGIFCHSQNTDREFCAKGISKLWTFSHRLQTIFCLSFHFYCFFCITFFHSCHSLYLWVSVAHFLRPDPRDSVPQKLKSVWKFSFTFDLVLGKFLHIYSEKQTRMFWLLAVLQMPCRIVQRNLQTRQNYLKKIN